MNRADSRTRPMQSSAWNQHVFGKLRTDEPTAWQSIRAAWFELVVCTYMIALTAACTAIALGLWDPFA